MLKKLITGLLALLCLPFICIGSLIAAVFIVAVLIAAFPFMLLGGSIKAGSALATKIVDFFSSTNQLQNHHWRGEIAAHLLLTFFLIPLAAGPIAIASAAAIGVAAILLLPAMVYTSTSYLVKKIGARLSSLLTSLEDNPTFADGYNLSASRHANLAQDGVGSSLQQENPAVPPPLFSPIFSEKEATSHPPSAEDSANDSLPLPII
ncbi:MULTISPECIES: hypothetical protein [unclassified Legionella]|uniref:hypothetical protein n=1 Tax=unclassified Legionella TaxID=2622702 RepID=UPI0010557D03|nr:MULTISPECIES: hypothetical protein [unclassified Legionella]MDI9817962.1 hypothetical protein [Legionella sp. PL877]